MDFLERAALEILAPDGARRLGALVPRALRPPLALQRLFRDEAGQLVYRMKRPRGGSLFLLLTPDELLSKLATLVPPKRTHGIRYHGLFAPNSSARRRVVPTAALAEPGAEVGRKARSGGKPRSKVEDARTYRVPWADLLRKVFALDVLACPECSGRMQLIAFIASEAVTRYILDHLGLDATGPPLARAQAPHDLLDPTPGHDVVDPVYTD